MNIIVKATIRTTSNNGRVAEAILSNGQGVTLFTYYEDEIIINAFELENKTVEEAQEIRRARQKAWERNYTFAFSGGTH